MTTFSSPSSAQSALAGLHPGHRYRATAYLGARQFATFGLDVVVETNMTGPPDRITNHTAIVVDGLPTAAYLTYPVADHIADKHAAMLSTYNQRASTRYRDLVDLLIIAGSQRVETHALRTALPSEYAHRNLPVRSEVMLPSNDWIAGYEQAATTAPNVTFTATEALAFVGKMLNPILDGRDNGTWNPTTATWVN